MHLIRLRYSLYCGVCAHVFLRDCGERTARQPPAASVVFTMSNRIERKSDLSSTFDKELENIFAVCKNNPNENQLIVKIITRHLLQQHLWRQLQYLSVIVLLAVTVYYVPLVNANLSAIGRIFLIKLLPVWNWERLTDERCLLGPLFTKNMYVTDADNQFTSAPQLYKDDCVLCENNGK